jgi:hypothetical protein
MRRQRAMVLITSLVVVLISAALVGASLSLSAAHNNLTWRYVESESALLLAEAGINDEFALINRSRLDGGEFESSAPDEDGRGRIGTVADVNGQFEVKTTAFGSETLPWTGSGRFWITSTGTVRGVRRTIRVTGGTQSVFDMYASFAVNSANADNNVFTLNGTDVTIDGVIGTNGDVQGSISPSRLRFTQAINANTANYSSQFRVSSYPGANIVNWNFRVDFPTVTEIARHSFPGQSDVWAYLRTTNDNSRIRTFTESGASLTADGTEVAQIIPVDLNPWVTGYTGGNLSGPQKDFGAWAYARPGPGTDGKRALIFPPGDYVFPRIDLVANPNCVIIIDNGGLTEPFSTSRPQVRFWIPPASSGNNQGDLIAVETRFSAPDDVQKFRLYYARGGALQLTAIRADGAFVTQGGVYATESGGTRIQFDSPAHARLFFLGSLISDRVGFSGNFSSASELGSARLIFPADPMGDDSDFMTGAGFVGGYTEL